MENKYSISEYQIFRELRYFSLIQKEVNFGIFFTYPLNISVPAGTGQEAIAQAESLALDVMLMDISILDLIGIEANQKILSILTERFLPVQEPSSPLQEGFSALKEGDSLIRGRFFPFRETFSPVRWAFFPGVVFFLGKGFSLLAVDHPLVGLVRIGTMGKFYKFRMGLKSNAPFNTGHLSGVGGEMPKVESGIRG